MNIVSSSNSNKSPQRTDAVRARGAALRLLTTRGRSVTEMRERLGLRFDKETVEQTISRLLEEGLLDDAKFAGQWRESRERRKPRSPSMIARELKQRGIAEEVIEDTLEGFDSLDAAQRAAARYAARQAGTDRATFDRKVGAFLTRRGFEPGVVIKTLEQMRDELGIKRGGTTEFTGC